MRNKKLILLSVIIVLALAALLVFYFRYSESKKYEKQGIELISKIEEYRKQNNKLPNTVADLGLVEPMNQGPYYEKKDSLNYIVFFSKRSSCEALSRHDKIFYSKPTCLL